MELKNYIFFGLMIIGLSGIVGSFIMNSAYNYGVEVDDNLSNLLVGQDYSEFLEVQKVTAEDSVSTNDLAEYSVGSEFDLFSKSTLNRISTWITQTGNYLEIDNGVRDFIIALLAAGVTIGGIYFLRNRN